MLRPFLSVLVAGVTSAIGVSLVAVGGVAHLNSQASFAGARMDVGALAFIAVGVVLLGVAALTLTIHWVGILIVGAVHAVLGLLALVIPFGNPFQGGVFSPVFQITRMFGGLDRNLGDGLAVYYFSGAALVVGAFLVAAALGVRSRRLAEPASASVAAVTSVLGGLLLLGAAAALLLGGGEFVAVLLRTLRYDPVLAVGAIAAGVLAGVGGLLLRWSSAGAIVAGAIILLAGAVMLFDPLRIGPAFSGWMVGGYGLLLVVGVTVLGAALGALVRGPEAVPAHRDAL